MLTRKAAIEFLKNSPVKYARLLGFDKLSELHNQWVQEMLCGKNDYTLMSHRASYKTTCVSLALAITIILLPRTRTLFIRKTDSDIKEVIKQVKKILLDPHTQYFVQVIYGVSLRLTVQSATEISTNLSTDIKGTNQLVGIGIGSSLTGKHFDRIFTDDIINVNDRISKAERDKTKLIYQELQNIKNRGGKIFNTLTPWHPDSAESLMPNIHKYDCYETGLISDSELTDIRSKMIPSLFACNYELKHIASEDVIFTNPQINGDPAMVEQGDGHIDAAYGGEDYTAFTIYKKSGGKYYLFGKLWHKHVDDCLDEICNFRAHFNAGRIYCEDNGDKGYLKKDLIRRGERAVSYHENQNKFIKITSYLKNVWKDVIFVAGTDQDYINQICDYNENAEHDDAPDSAASAVRRVWQKKDDSTFIPLW